MYRRNTKQVLLARLLPALLSCLAATGWCASGPIIELNF